MQTDSEYESDVSSLTDSSRRSSQKILTSKSDCEDLIKRIDSLTQENRVLQIELQTFKLRLKASQQEIKQLKHESLNIQVKAEQEEEFISNTLFKKIQELKKEKETLANNYEREEEFLTNDLSRKLQQIQKEKQSLEQSLEQEQAVQINQLMKRIHRLERETINKQNTLEQLKREKIELENTLEKEQESLVNRLWKRMEKLETDKKLLQFKIQQPNNSNEQIHADNADELKQEVDRLRQELVLQQEMHEKKLEQLRLEELDAKNENLRLQRKLQLEVDRRQQLYKQLSESESSLEMGEERAWNDKIKSDIQRTSLSSSSSQLNLARSRTASSPAFIINQTSEFLQKTYLPSSHNSME